MLLYLGDWNAKVKNKTDSNIVRNFLEVSEGNNLFIEKTCCRQENRLHNQKQMMENLYFLC